MNKLTTKKKLFLVIDLIAIVLLVVLDQFTKHLAVTRLMDKDSISRGFCFI